MSPSSSSIDGQDSESDFDDLVKLSTPAAGPLDREAPETGLEIDSKTLAELEDDEEPSESPPEPSPLSDAEDSELESSQPPSSKPPKSSPPPTPTPNGAAGPEKPS